MFIHYFIILHGFIVVFSSTNKGSTLIFIINSLKSRHTLALNSNLYTYANSRSNWIPTNVHRIVNVFKRHENANHTRIRREFLRENTINDEDNVNIYGDNDGKYFRNRKEEIAEQKRDFDREYYLPIKNKFKMSKVKPSAV